MRQIAGNELESATKSPAVIAYPARTAAGRLGVIDHAERGTQLKLLGREVPLDGNGRFEVSLSPDELSRGLSWAAEKGPDRKTWRWPGLE